MGFPGGLDGKTSACNVGDPGSIPGLGRSPGEGNGNPIQYACLENPHGQRSLAGYSPWGCKSPTQLSNQSNTTNNMVTLGIHFHFSQLPAKTWVAKKEFSFTYSY